MEPLTIAMLLVAFVTGIVLGRISMALQVASLRKHQVRSKRKQDTSMR